MELERHKNLKIAKRIEKHVSLAKFKSKALDLGCGEGWLSEILKKKGHYVVGLDTDPLKLKLAKKNCDEIVRYKIKNHLPFKNSYFDFILCSDLLEHLENPEIIIKEISRVLKSKGEALIKVPYGPLDFLFMLEGHKQFFTNRKIKKMLEHANFVITKEEHFLIIPLFRVLIRQVPQFLIFKLKKLD